MIEELAAALATLDRKAAKRLVKCLPVLGEALANWSGHAGDDALVLACATPRAGLVLSASDWPQLGPTTIDRGDAAMALVNAIDNGGTEVIISALAVLLGEEGIKAHGVDVARIAANGNRALTVLLVEKRGKNLTMLATTLERPVGGATLH